MNYSIFFSFALISITLITKSMDTPTSLNNNYAQGDFTEAYIALAGRIQKRLEDKSFYSDANICTDIDNIDKLFNKISEFQKNKNIKKSMINNLLQQKIMLVNLRNLRQSAYQTSVKRINAILKIMQKGDAN